MIKINELYFELIKKIDKNIIKEFECLLNNIEIKNNWKDKDFEIELDFSEKPREISESLTKNKNPIIVFKEDINLIHELKISFLNSTGNTPNQYKNFLKFEIREKRYESLSEIIFNLEGSTVISIKENTNNLGVFDFSYTEIFGYKKIEEYLVYKELEIKNDSEEAQEYFQLKYDIDFKTDRLYGALDRIFNKVYRII